MIRYRSDTYASDRYLIDLIPRVFQAAIRLCTDNLDAQVHYNDVIMSAMASQITSLTIVYSTVYSGTDQRTHQSSTSLAFLRGIRRWPVNSPHKGPVTRKMFLFDDVFMRKKTPLTNHCAAKPPDPNLLHRGALQFLSSCTECIHRTMKYWHQLENCFAYRTCCRFIKLYHQTHGNVIFFAQNLSYCDIMICHHDWNNPFHCKT